MSRKPTGHPDRCSSKELWTWIEMKEMHDRMDEEIQGKPDQVFD